MLRVKLSNALKVSMKAQDKLTLGTVRLILASIKDQDIAARSSGNLEGISDFQVLALLQTMVKQRHESIRLYEEGERIELAAQEKNEIKVIRRFMPAQIGDGELETVVKQAIQESNAKELKDIGKTMGFLKANYPGRIDFSKASTMIRDILSS